jgi:putative flippase GtrA
MKITEKLINIFTPKHYRYIIVGSLVFLINILAADLLFNLEQFKSNQWNKNFANLISLEIALLISYPLHKRITWLEGWEDFFPKLLKFHIISMVGIVLRLLIFYILDSMGIHWKVSTYLSIIVIVLYNFISFDIFVFNHSKIINNEDSYSETGSGRNTLETIEEAETYNRWIAYKIEDYLGEKNLEIGAGTGTIAKIISEKYKIELLELSESNRNTLSERFKETPNILNISGDLLKNENYNYYNCIYSSNVLEHIENDEHIVYHSMKLLTQGGYFVALVPAMNSLYSDFDKKIGHFRRYSKKDLIRITNYLNMNNINYRLLESSYFNPIGAVGWFIKMKILKNKQINPRDAMIMNSLIPFVSWLDLLPLGFGQSMLLVIKKIN